MRQVFASEVGRAVLVCLLGCAVRALRHNGEAAAAQRGRPLAAHSPDGKS
ncbi:hypothetical protein GCM10022222_37970 [Amycolatopsis ultiminotia]|uniref:Lipoprotein n=1 Tax=Amycolatopsis ultiminotia TaxID=543629 RepID=A0ABP6WJ40_9PSEU